MKHVLFFLMAVVAWGQSEVRISPKPSDTPYTTILGGYSGSNATYICVANSQQPTSGSISIASATAASPIVFTVTAGHGFALNTLNLPTVTISGGTGNWAAVNGTWTATPILSTTFSVAINGAAFGAVTGSLVYTTRAPLLTSRIWSVRALSYDAGGNLAFAGWSNGTSAMNQVCTSPTSSQ